MHEITFSIAVLNGTCFFLSVNTNEKLFKPSYIKQKSKINIGVRLG